jgi:hypothetical protein
MHRAYPQVGLSVSTLATLSSIILSIKFHPRIFICLPNSCLAISAPPFSTEYIGLVFFTFTFGRLASEVLVQIDDEDEYLCCKELLGQFIRITPFFVLAVL